MSRYVVVTTTRFKVSEINPINQNASSFVHARYATCGTDLGRGMGIENAAVVVLVRRRGMDRGDTDASGVGRVRVVLIPIPISVDDVDGLGLGLGREAVIDDEDEDDARGIGIQTTTPEIRRTTMRR